MAYEILSEAQLDRLVAYATDNQGLLAEKDIDVNLIRGRGRFEMPSTGKAQLHIAPRMDAASSRPYEDEEDILEHLKSVFANPNRKAEAYSAYHQLTMKPRDSFIDFLAEFLQLAEEACVVQENRKRDLYLKHLPSLISLFRSVSDIRAGVDPSRFTREVEEVVVVLDPA
jgi:hypothetical protein